MLTDQSLSPFDHGHDAGNGEPQLFDPLSSTFVLEEADLNAPTGSESAGDDTLDEARQRLPPRDSPDSSDPVRQYLQEIARTPLLSARQEVTLAETIEAGGQALTLHQELARRGALDPARDRELQAEIVAGETARRRLTEANLRLVVSVAKKYLGHGLPILDLIQEGNIGLMRATERFDYQRGVRFSTYAVWWIRQAITRALSDQGRVIRLPVHMSDALGRYLRATRRLSQELGRPPTEAEIARALDIPVERVAEIERLPAEAISLDLPVGSETDASLADFVPDAAPGPSELVAVRQLRDQLELALAELRPRERRVLRLHFGLDDNQPRTLEEVGREFGVSRERIRQVEQKALRSLRHPATARRLRDFIG